MIKFSDEVPAWGAPTHLSMVGMNQGKVFFPLNWCHVCGTSPPGGVMIRTVVAEIFIPLPLVVMRAAFVLCISAAADVVVLLRIEGLVAFCHTCVVSHHGMAGYKLD